ncbi:hypothetical protein [Paraliomyxa miuraensis]|uniref:hypothetical protein n=1 Tax=Paraliomyxa miuraensis TaxID=376150 RepID=UPI002254DE46|nr:hypothetical protein [Paraliomyxa miuraensis]MCX4248036.1 hypothetical protein [Paraliomyxa miuraensis]
MPDSKMQNALTDIDRVLAYKPAISEGSGRNHERSVLICQCIERWAPAQSAYRRKAREHLEDRAGAYSPHLFEAILQALRADIVAGQLLDFEALVHANLFSDFLSQAENLNAQGYRRAAAVVAGGSLEEHIRQLARRNGIAVLSSRGKPREASALNADLYSSANAYTKATHAQIDAWQKTRNAAAHGEANFEVSYTDAEVRRMIDGVRDFIMKYPG